MNPPRRTQELPDPETGDSCGEDLAGSGTPGADRTPLPASDSGPAAEAEAAAGPDAIWEAYDQALAAATRERDRALDKASTRLASVTAGGYLEYDRSVSLAWAAFESATRNARLAHAAQPR